MINIIFSIDPTTEFLSLIIENLKKESVRFNLIKIEPNNESYNKAKLEVSNLKKKSIILFLGHGQENHLYGGESGNFKKKPFVKDTEMQLFNNQFLFALACNSSDLFRRSFRFSDIIKSIGFGALPTEMKEIEKDKRLKEYITEENVESFKKSIIDIVTYTFIEVSKNSTFDFDWVKNYMILLINKKINSAILEDKDRGLADLLYDMKTGVKIF